MEDPEETAGILTRLAEERGGYIEGIWQGMVILRVPAAGFFEALEEVLSLGRVLDRSVETRDVTNLIQDLAGRREIARASRERLYALLEKTEDAGQRVRILREIRRLTEELERLAALLSSLEKQVAYSRIQVELRPRLSRESTLRQGIPFPWIASLHPLNPTLTSEKPAAAPDLGDEFAVFPDLPYYSAESPEGIRFRLGMGTNNPRGDEEFWLRALEFHLKPLYAEGMVFPGRQDRRFGHILLESKDREPYYYLVGVLVQGDKLLVAEAFFPNGELKSKGLERIQAALEEVAR